MDLLINFLGRLSQSFFPSAPHQAQPRHRKPHNPSLKLISNNRGVAGEVDGVQGRSAPSTVGHAEAVEDALARSTGWLLDQQNPEHGYWVQ